MNVFDAPERVRRDSPPRRTDVPIHSRDRREIRIAASDLKSLNSAIQLDQLLYDTIVRRSRYTSADIVTNILEDFFIYNLAMKLNVIFTPRNPALYPDTLGKFLTVTLINLAPMERCRLLFELYPCQHLTPQDLETCGRLGFTRCSPANDPPEGYDYGIWDILDQMKEKLSTAMDIMKKITNLMLSYAQWMDQEGGKGRSSRRDLLEREQDLDQGRSLTPDLAQTSLQQEQPR